MTPTGGVPLIPRKTLFGNPRRLEPKISPDGRWLSWLAPTDGVMNIWIAPVDAPDAARPLTRHTDRPVPFQWFARTSEHILYGRDTGGDENFHLWCASIDGSPPRDLTPCGAVTVRWYGAHLQERNLVAIGLNDRDPRWHDLYALDLRSGTRRLLHENATEIAQYIVDHALGLRMATRARKDGGGRTLLRWSDGRFEELLAIDLEDDLNTQPLFFNRAGDAWYLLTSQRRDTAALFRVDWASGERRLLAGDARADVFGSIIVDPGSWEPLAVRCGYIFPQWIATDPATGSELAWIEREVGTPVDFAGQSEDRRYWIAAGSAPDRPVTYFLVDRNARRITKLFAARPDLEGVKLATMHGFIIKARDGLDMVSYLTLPASEAGARPARPLPMVLNVHGGPQARDNRAYRADHQWLANRGYAVLSVNYRGSNGFGKAHVNAGIKEWGAKMHDDLIDAVEWAIAEGIADPARVAIYGGSYGGYAAFVGATFTPEVFACSVPIVGITNLETMLAAIPPYWQASFEHFAERIGDPRTEGGRALLRARSPLYKAANITKPMLIGHGLNDPRCRITESDQIVAAMRERNIPVTYVVFPDEGHGFARPENRLAFNAITEAFLARHLGGRCEGVGDDFQGSTRGACRRRDPRRHRCGAAVRYPRRGNGRNARPVIRVAAASRKMPFGRATRAAHQQWARTLRTAIDGLPTRPGALLSYPLRGTRSQGHGLNLAKAHDVHEGRARWGSGTALDLLQGGRLREARRLQKGGLSAELLVGKGVRWLRLGAIPAEIARAVQGRCSAPGVVGVGVGIGRRA